MSEALIDLTAVLDQIVTPLFLLNGRNQLIYANEAFWRATGLDPATALGTTCRPGTMLSHDVQAGVLAGLGPPEQLYELGTAAERPWPVPPAGSPSTAAPDVVLFVPCPAPGGEPVVTLAVGLPRQTPSARTPSATREDFVELLARLRAELLSQYGVAHYVAVAPRSVRILKQLQVLASSHAREPILLCGPPGTGKSHLATIYYQLSSPSGPLVFYDCRDRTPEEAADELLGTDATEDNDAPSDSVQTPALSYFQQAQAGVLVLEHVEHLAGAVVARLREAYEGTAPATRPALVVTSRLSMGELAKALGEELAEWLGTFCLQVPPLTERSEDIVPLAVHFLERYRSSHGGRTEALDDSACELLLRYDWPGNVRQLAEVIELACRKAADRTHLTADDLPAAIKGALGSPYPPPPIEEFTVDLAELLRAAEERILRFALAVYRGNRAAAARALGLSRAALLRRLEALGIQD